MQLISQARRHCRLVHVRHRVAWAGTDNVLITHVHSVTVHLSEGSFVRKVWDEVGLWLWLGLMLCQMSYEIPQSAYMKQHSDNRWRVKIHLFSAYQHVYRIRGVSHNALYKLRYLLTYLLRVRVWVRVRARLGLGLELVRVRVMVRAMVRVRVTFRVRFSVKFKNLHNYISVKWPFGQDFP